MSIQILPTRAARTEDNRRRLLDAAHQVFRERGYHGTTLDQVARVAGLTKGAVYARYASKADLFLALVEDGLDERVRQILEAPAKPGAASAAEATHLAWLERARGDRAWTLLLLEFRVEALRSDELSRRFAALHDRIVAAVTRRIEVGARAAGVEPPQRASTIVRMGLAMATGLVLEQALAGPEELPDWASHAAAHAVFDALSAHVATGGASGATR